MIQQMRAFDTYTHINELKKAGFNEEQAAVIIKSLVDSRETDISHLATKEQVNKLEASTIESINKLEASTIERFNKLEISTIERINKLEASTTEQIFEVKTQINALDKKIDVSIAKLEAKISDTHTNTIKWMVGTMIALAGILIAGIKLL
jgi:hypothetical protein